MKAFIVTMMVLGGLATATVWAEEQGNVAAAPAAAVEQAAAPAADARPVDVGNKICPVSKEKVGGEMGDQPVKIVYQGKSYNLCCKMCIKDFNKDPEKYIKLIPALEKQTESKTN